MPEYVTSRCLLKCGFGDTPVRCQSLPLLGKPVFTEAFDAATILNMIPVVNIPAFGICPSLANPQVAAATAAAQGALTLDAVRVCDPGVLGMAFADRRVGWRAVCDGAMQAPLHLWRRNLGHSAGRDRRKAIRVGVVTRGAIER